jgi:hypothetical protein
MTPAVQQEEENGDHCGNDPCRGNQRQGVVDETRKGERSRNVHDGSLDLQPSHREGERGIFPALFPRERRRVACNLVHCRLGLLQTGRALGVPEAKQCFRP